MEKDFYIDKRWLASYFEKDWSDKFLPQQSSVPFQFAPFSAEKLYSPYHEEFVGFVSATLQKSNLKPQQMLEVGSSVGRTFYEVARSVDSIRKAVLVEPSQNLANTFTSLFESTGAVSYPFLLGNSELSEIQFDAADIQKSSAHIERTLLNKPFADVGAELPVFDLVLCSNVIDQCENPNSLVQFLSDQTAKGGALALSCSYQWNDKYIDKNEKRIENINDLFDGQKWQHLGETNIEFKCRRSERHWVTFLSHVAVFKKI